MSVFEVLIALLLGGAALAGLARKIGAPYPALVALAGAGLALLPGMPAIELDPNLALTLFIAPVLLDAAFDSPMRDLKSEWRPVASLALGAVVLTVGIVAIVARALVPELPWYAAIALGAIVAPPDAAAASAILKQLKPPHRLLVILEGESLFNDASALLIYRLALAAAVEGAVTGWNIGWEMLIVTIGSLVLGLVLAKVTRLINQHINDVSLGVVVQFCTAFGVWILAERLHLSGIITTVVFAMAASRHSPETLPARMRIPSWAVWEVAVFVLNVLAFILVGLQLRLVLSRATGPAGTLYLLVAIVVLVTVILARFAWVLGASAFSRWRGNHDVTFAGSLVIGWSGMRGTVTLATALALPLQFPQRDLILATAFGVVLGTLVIQGLTLKPLLKLLKLRDYGEVDREVLFARTETLRAAVEALGGESATETTTHVRESYELQLTRAKKAAAGHGKGAAKNAELNRKDATDQQIIEIANKAQRKKLVALRTEGTIGDDAFQRVEEELDWMELGWAQVLR